MEPILQILHSDRKPKDKQRRLVDAVCSGKIPVKGFIAFFQSAPDSEKGACADAMKHISALNPELLVPYTDILAGYINHQVPRVMWGIPETFGNLAQKYPEKTLPAIPFLQKNTVGTGTNTTVIRWCAAYGLAEIAKNSEKSRKKLIPWIHHALKREKNNGVRNVYLKALKAIEKNEK